MKRTDLAKKGLLLANHPCFNEQAHFKIGRIHLPVAPGCNIHCNYCLRSHDSSENRPGVCQGVITPEIALDRVNNALKVLDNIQVVGVAGPGEPLLNKSTFKTFKLIRDMHPELILCVATNGLMLPEKAHLLKKLNVKTITVTLNTLDPAIGAKIYEYVTWEKIRIDREEGARILLEKQLKGIEKAINLGFHIKINTVLIPDINSDCIPKIARKMAEFGVVLMNIIPVIPLGNFANIRGPDCNELREARNSAEKFLPQFRFCKQCSADAAGIPGREECIDKTQRKLSMRYYHG